jgi:hypothetical protein
VQQILNTEYTDLVDLRAERKAARYRKLAGTLAD